jgi:hypothetical protein
MTVPSIRIRPVPLVNRPSTEVFRPSAHHTRALEQLVQATQFLTPLLIPPELVL